MSQKSCALDPLPASCIEMCLDEIVLTVTEVVNDSLAKGVVPSAFKHAIVKPLLKKANLDPENLKNYRPVSNLPFFSKVLERVVLHQLLEHLAANGLLEPFQSAYRKGHSTETALLHVVNDLLQAADIGHVSILSLLDFSAAFDTIDHSIMCTKLEDFGCVGLVGKWFESYLTGRTQCVVIDDKCSKTTKLDYGVPQGSVLGPVLFTIYTSTLGSIV